MPEHLSFHWVHVHVSDLSVLTLGPLHSPQQRARAMARLYYVSVDRSLNSLPSERYAVAELLNLPW